MVEMEAGSKSEELKKGYMDVKNMHQPIHLLPLLLLKWKLVGFGSFWPQKMSKSQRYGNMLLRYQ